MKEVRKTEVVTEETLCEELQALVKEFYLGRTARAGRDLLLTLPNGQQFSLRVQERK